MVSSAEDKAPERREHVLQAYYERLNNLDKSIRELTSFFFGINMAVLALVFQVIRNDLQRFVLASVGYCVSITIFLILLMAAVMCVPWACFVGIWRPRLIWATFQGLWAREV